MKLRNGLILLSMLFCGACSGNSGTGAEDTTAVVPSSPSAPTTPQQTVLQPGDYNKTITIGSDQRTYILHVPAKYDGSKALPLVFVLHGHGGTAKGMVKLTGMNEKADQDSFFVAYLQGTEGTEGTGWNTGINHNNVITVDDVAFVRDLLNQLEEQLNVDNKRVYAAGFSNGAGMCHRLGAELPDILAGVAVVEGTIGFSEDGVSFTTIPQPKGPIPVVMINGVQDPVVPYDGGQNIHGYVPSVADALAFWTVADACSGTPHTHTSSDGNVITDDYTNCANGSEVELLTIVSGVHKWPTLENKAAFDGTEAIWKFFSRHSKN